MDLYPPIADHGLIGDLQTAALVSANGTVDWFCCPRFDSPSVFASLLDHERGGHFQVSPLYQSYESRQLYYPDSAVLITRFTTESGTGEVVDFMPPAGRQPTGNHRLVRMIRCARGRMEFDVEIAARFDYGRRGHAVHLTGAGVVLDSGSQTLTLHGLPDNASVTDGETVRGSFTLAAGEVRGVVLESDAPGPPSAISPERFQQLFDETVAFWHDWLAGSTYRGRWREAVNRSAITLKLLTYAPTGAIVAAPTAGLPEQIGGERNWDYRYTWIRDASFSVNSLLALGFTSEARDFAQWLGRRYRERPEHSDGPLQIMYRVDGTPDLDEEVLNHWEGYRGSSPVRVGNDAAGQLQLDIYGEALDSLHDAERNGLHIGHRGWQAVVSLLDWLAENWDRAEEGIWETRGGRADFTYGRVMSWVAFDRAVRLAARHGRPGPLERWRSLRDSVYAQIWERGWHPGRQAFVQQYDSDVLDASLLRMPKVGFVAPTDPQWLSTLSAMRTGLVTDSLVYRYDPASSPDGLRGCEGTFSLCTFGYVDALARAGELTQARLVFEKMLTYSNHLGLFAEEIGPTGEQLGNFPQAFTHLALVDAAITLDRALDA
ncbi:glucoamylase [Lentzea sp. NBRC 105346]|uniref:glycoside hydrolase family 15 protein n=1 Tax=Lentzea sp. NBRC 105346 TaxID=3032205 RepID=UPI0024A4B072|nr:glycoside hydrolase family 15 protein [Lentzea sp. NBRC 105346]GLZ31009.1 glucoamylase [Lentzea sp. NBRC 105346]